MIHDLFIPSAYINFNYYHYAFEQPAVYREGGCETKKKEDYVRNTKCTLQYDLITAYGYLLKLKFFFLSLGTSNLD